MSRPVEGNDHHDDQDFSEYGEYNNNHEISSRDHDARNYHYTKNFEDSENARKEDEEEYEDSEGGASSSQGFGMLEEVPGEHHERYHGRRFSEESNVSWNSGYGSEENDSLVNSSPHNSRMRGNHFSEDEEDFESSSEDDVPDLIDSEAGSVIHETRDPQFATFPARLDSGHLEDEEMATQSQGPETPKRSRGWSASSLFRKLPSTPLSRRSKAGTPKQINDVNDKAPESRSSLRLPRTPHSLFKKRHTSANTANTATETKEDTSSRSIRKRAFSASSLSSFVSSPMSLLRKRSSGTPRSDTSKDEESKKTSEANGTPRRRRFWSSSSLESNEATFKTPTEEKQEVLSETDSTKEEKRQHRESKFGRLRSVMKSSAHRLAHFGRSEKSSKQNKTKSFSLEDTSKAPSPSRPSASLSGSENDDESDSDHESGSEGSDDVSDYECDRICLTAFYLQHRPENADKVPYFLEKYEDDIDSLFDTVEKRYNAQVPTYRDAVQIIKNYESEHRFNAAGDDGEHELEPPIPPKPQGYSPRSPDKSSPLTIDTTTFEDSPVGEPFGTVSRIWVTSKPTPVIGFSYLEHNRAILLHLDEKVIRSRSADSILKSLRRIHGSYLHGSYASLLRSIQNLQLHLGVPNVDNDPILDPQASPQPQSDEHMIPLRPEVDTSYMPDQFRHDLDADQGSENTRSSIYNGDEENQENSDACNPIDEDDDEIYKSGDDQVRMETEKEEDDDYSEDRDSSNSEDTDTEDTLVETQSNEQFHVKALVNQKEERITAIEREEAENAPDWMWEGREFPDEKSSQHDQANCDQNKDDSEAEDASSEGSWDRDTETADESSAPATSPRANAPDLTKGGNALVDRVPDKVDGKQSNEDDDYFDDDDHSTESSVVDNESSVGNNDKREPPQVPSRSEITFDIQEDGTSFRDRADAEPLRQWKKRIHLVDNVIFEIVDSERKYYNDLDTINDFVILPMLEQHQKRKLRFTEKGADKLLTFLRLWSKLTRFHEGLNERLWRRCVDESCNRNGVPLKVSWEEQQQPMYSALEEMYSIREACHLYDDYCLLYATSVACYAKELQNNQGLLLFLRNNCEGALRGQTLESFFIKPVQRFCKYPLLLQTLAKHQASFTPRQRMANDMISRTVKEMEGWVEQINIHKAQAEQLSVMASLSNRLRFGQDESSVSLTESHRVLLQADTISIIRDGQGEPEERFAILYNDVLLTTVVRKSWLNPLTKVYDVMGVLPLRYADIAHFNSTPNPAKLNAYDCARLECDEWEGIQVLDLGFPNPTVAKLWKASLEEALSFASNELNQHRDDNLLSQIAKKINNKRHQSTVVRNLLEKKSRVSRTFGRLHETSAVAIQKTFRGLIGRRRATEKKSEITKEISAALIIQRAFKRFKKRLYWKKQQHLELARKDRIAAASEKARAPNSPDYSDNEEDTTLHHISSHQEDEENEGEDQDPYADWDDTDSENYSQNRYRPSQLQQAATRRPPQNHIVDDTDGERSLSDFDAFDEAVGVHFNDDDEDEEAV